MNTTITTCMCPRCNERRFTPYGTDLSALTEVEKDRLLAVAKFPALSRMDNATYICNWCGDDEAMRDHWGAAPIPPEQWPVTEAGRWATKSD